MGNEKVIVKVGEDYVCDISPKNGLVLTREQALKLQFENKKVASAYLCLIESIYNDTEKVEIISVEEDLKKNNLSGYSLEEVLKKAKPLTLEKAKSLYENGNVLTMRKSWNTDKNAIYTCVVRSQSNRYANYEVEIVTDKYKKLVSTSCKCYNFTEQNNLHCKHILASILYILNF